MQNYFDVLLEQLESISSITIYKKHIKKEKINCGDFSVFGNEISEKIKYVYQNYSEFCVYWEDKISKQNGTIIWIPYFELEKRHMDLVETSIECYNPEIENIEMICNDIKKWYPLFEFPNGDAFCLDQSSGKVVFYEHEVYDTGANLHGLLIANNIDELYAKWFKCLCVDVYDWYDAVDENGLDMNNDFWKNYKNSILIE